MKQLFLSVCLVVMTMVSLFAQASGDDAQKILDRASSKLRSAKGIITNFSLTQKDKSNHLQGTAKGIVKIKGNKYVLTGNLTMKGITKPVELVAEYGGMAPDTNGKTKIGFEVTGSISRWEFGLTYNAVMEAGGLILGEDVVVEANIQLVQV